jgi:hypothetical protein
MSSTVALNLTNIIRTGGKMSKTTAITGACGEHYVAAYLSALDFVVALPRGGVPSCDLLVTTESAGKSISIQVKTATSPLNKLRGEHYYAWPTSAKAMNLVSNSHWYAFVNLNNWPENDTHPEVFFIPSNIVAAEIKKAYENEDKWLFFCINCSDAEQYKGKKGISIIQGTLPIQRTKYPKSV